MKKTLSICLLLACVTGEQASGASITIGASNFTFNEFSGFSSSARYAWSGNVLASVDDPTPIGGLVISTTQYRGPILAANEAFTEYGELTMDFTGLIRPGGVGGTQFVPALFTPAVPNPPTDPALLALMPPVQMRFVFEHESTTTHSITYSLPHGFPGVTLEFPQFNYRLTEIELITDVPEPGSASLLFGALALISWRARVRRPRRP